MGRRPDPSTIARRDQILAVLRDADRPLTTMELSERVQRRRYPSDVYRDLCAMERQHRVRRHERLHYRCLLWAFVSPEDEKQDGSVLNVRLRGEGQA